MAPAAPEAKRKTAWPRAPRPLSRDHSQQERSATASTKSDHAAALAKKSIPRKTARNATAVMTRVRSKAGQPARIAGSPAFNCSLVRPKRRSRWR